MTITVTEKEYDAISFAIGQIETSVEAATDEEYLADAEVNLNALYSVMGKYKKARQKANEFQYIRAEVARRACNRGLRPRDIDKLTRQLIKRMQ
ncbi:MAG: hypothetical protein IJS63_09365 [Bacteroidaceae bacterium]|nr:hypothetical protein [Bacteroidaceae bacterium]